MTHQLQFISESVTDLILGGRDLAHWVLPKDRWGVMYDPKFDPESGKDLKSFLSLSVRELLVNDICSR